MYVNDAVIINALFCGVQFRINLQNSPKNFIVQLTVNIKVNEVSKLYLKN